MILIKESVVVTIMKDQLRCADFPKVEDGRTYHVGVKRGEGIKLN